MVRRKIRLGTALSLSGMVAVSPWAAACGGGDSYEDWAATDGAAGRINLDEVQAAFKDSKSVTDFERRVNEIYEGDGLILIRAKQDGSQLTLEGWEDLNSNGEIEDSSDDQLFDIVKGTNDEYDMRGYHGNGYYNSHFGAGDFLFTYLLISAITPRFGGYYYSTPPSRGPEIRNQRTTYRNSSAYGGQVRRNASYGSRQASFAGSRYQQSRGNVSSNRSSYQSTQKSSGSFRTSNSVSRSSSSVRSSSRSSSGGFGGGGAMRLRRGI
jgi:hypothetical protein